MEFIQLEAFLEATERGSFRRAAEFLELSQPSVSARIQSLEKELGVPLFHRMGRGVRLTDAAKAFKPYAERCMDSLRQGKNIVQSAMNLEGGTLHIASARVTGTYSLPSIVHKFRLQHPNVNVHINIGRSSDVLQMVLNEEAQLGLGRELTHPDVITMHLYDEDVCLATSPDHPFALKGEASIFEVAREPLILYDRDSSYFVLISQVCRESGILPRVEMTLDSVEATKHFVELGMGISFLPRVAVSAELERGSLSLIPLQGGHLVSLPTALTIKRAQHYSSAVLSFVDVLKDFHDFDLSELNI